MTSETLKPFITLPNQSSTYDEATRTIKVIMIVFSTFFTIILLCMLGLVIYNSIRVDNLQNEVKVLTDVVNNMQKRLGLDYIDESNESDDTFSNALWSSEEKEDNNFDPFDEDDEQGDYIHSGSGLFVLGSDTYDEYDDDDDDEEYELDDSMDVDSDYEDMPKLKDSKERKERSAQLHNKLPEPQVTNDQEKVIQKGSIASLLSHKDSTQKSNEMFVLYDNKQKRNKHKRSRNKKKSKDQHNPLEHVRSKKRRNIRGYVRPLLPEMQEQYLERFRERSAHPVALHYLLNSTKISQNGHPYHEVNPRPHNGDIYIGHIPSWVHDLGLDHSFEIDSGTITIKEQGLYLIYAQVFYNNHMDRNGFFVYHNTHPFIQCALTVPTETVKGNTCFTSGITYLERDDTIHLRDLFKDRVVTLRGPKSFLGMVKLSSSSRV